MRLLSITVCFISTICCLACSNLNKPKPIKKVWPPVLRFYYRSGGCNNGYCTYRDYLVLENYANKTYRLNELAEEALRYLDTAKGDQPIDGVTFVGEASDTKLPPGMDKTASEYSEYQVVSITFDSISQDKKNISAPKRHIGFVALWKKGEATTFTSPSVDSLVEANPLLDNEK